MKTIYLDYNATTPIDPGVLAAMRPFLETHFGNPSSSHRPGHRARQAVDAARGQVARLIGAPPESIVFTSGGSEASNLAIKGIVMASRGGIRDAHVVTSVVEHPATLEPCAFLERLGCRVTRLPVDRHGVVDLDALAAALRRPTALVTVMHANNEVGSIQSVKEIAALAHAHGALVHADAAQSVGKIPVDVGDLGVDLLSLAGHKMYAPKGIGALYVRPGVVLEPLIHGGGHEGGRRAGTENVPYVVGLGAACEIVGSRPHEGRALLDLRERLWTALVTGLGDGVVLNGHPERRLPNTLNVSVVGRQGADVLAVVPEIAASTGSACHEGTDHGSPVLAAMGLAPALARAAIRLSVGRFTTAADVDEAAALLVKAAKHRRSAIGAPAAI